MFDPTTFDPIHNAISSQALAGGASPCASQDGQTTDQCGQEAALASPSAVPENKKGKSDERHLWPVWFDLIRECHPATVFGEQVASAVAHGWLDDVYQDLESEGYACGAAVLPACSVGAPHKRDRLWFVADAQHDGSHGTALRERYAQTIRDNAQRQDGAGELARSGSSRNVPIGTMADTTVNGRGQGDADASRRGKGTCKEQRPVLGDYGKSVVVDTHNAGSQGHGRLVEQHDAQGWQEPNGRNTTAGFWNSGEWINCPDGKARLIEPSIPLLAYGVSSRVGRLRAYGNAIVPQVASEFIRAFLNLRLVKPYDLTADNAGIFG